MGYDERAEAGDEWTAKAMLLGAEIAIDQSVWGVLWKAYLPVDGARVFYGATEARACRKLVRSITGVE